MNTFHFSTDWATSLLILASILLLILCFILFFVRRKREKTQPKVNSVSESVVRDQEEDQDPIEQSEKIPDEKPVQNILTEKVAQVEEIIPLPPVSIKRGTVKPDSGNLSASYALPTTRQRLSQHGDQAADSQCRPTDWRRESDRYGLCREYYETSS